MNLLIYSHYFAPSVGGVETIVQSLAAGASAPVSMRIAVISPFLDRSHGTERCIVEQLERLALDSGTEIQIYAQRLQDVRGVTPRKYGAPAKSVDHDVETKPVNRQFWHKVPSIPGPHLLQYIFWFFANRLSRWWDAAHRHLHYDLVYSPGINGTDADAVAVHV